MKVYRTRIENDPILDSLGILYNKILHIMLSKFDTDLKLIKNDFSKEYKIPTRWFNTIRVDIEGRIESIKECLKLNKSQKEESIKELIEYIKKQEVKRNNILQIIHRDSNELKDLKRLNNLIFKKKHRLDVLKFKLLKIEKQLTYDVQSMCLGTKDLFKKQHYIENKKYANIAEWQAKDYDGWKEFHTKWKKDWDFARSNQFYSIGSNDENNGNLCCTPTIQENGKITLRILIPKCLRTKEKYHYIKDIYFKHGHKEICRAISLHKLDCGDAISFRFMKDHKSWEIHVSIHEEKPEITIKDGGYIGVDLNIGFLACAVVMKNGELMNRDQGIFRIKMDLVGKTTNQSTAIIGDAIKDLISKAKYYNLPICIEELDFSKKKNTLKEKTPKKLRHMLSSFAYKKFYAILVSACQREGIKLKTVNPAFTSLLGRNLFMKRYGISVHHAAAICIARRGLELNEDLISNKFIKNSGFAVTCNLPERMNYKHYWKYLSAVQSVVKKSFNKQEKKKKVPKPRILSETDRVNGIALVASLRQELALSVGCGVLVVDKTTEL